MPNDWKSANGDYEIGYGKPPETHRFKKGQSGNPKGRPKQSGAVTIDLEKLLTESVPATRDGIPRPMSRKEVELRRTLQKAVKGDLRAIGYLLDQFAKHGAMMPPEIENGGGVLILPSDIPWEMALMMVRRFGRPPWSDAQRETMWPVYDETRSDEMRKIDQEIYGR